MKESKFHVNVNIFFLINLIEFMNENIHLKILLQTCLLNFCLSDYVNGKFYKHDTIFTKKINYISFKRVKLAWDYLFRKQLIDKFTF